MERKEASGTDLPARVAVRRDRRARRRPEPDPPMSRFVNDLRFAARTLRRSPGFALVAVLTLAVGIGATTAIFSVLHAVVLRPLPFPEPERLAWLSEVTPSGEDFSTSEPTFLDFRERARSFSRLAALTDRPVTLRGEREPQRLRGVAVTPDFFAALGVAPVLGRGFLPEEEAPDAAAAVLSHALWTSRFGADPRVVGRSLDLGGEAVPVVGVMPEGFVSPGDAEIWLPLAPSAGADRGDHALSMVGRLAPGVSAEAAATEMRAIAARLGERYPESNGGWSVRLAPLRERMIGGELTRTMWVLMGAVGLLLLLMCANLANLLLARGVSRRREMGLRAALGAGRGRLAGQLLAESLLLAGAGGAAGLLVAAWGVPLLKLLLPPSTPRLAGIGVNGTVLSFALAASAGCALLFGLFPALQASSSDVRTALREGSRGSAAAGRRVRDALVVGEVALAMTLLVAAALLAGSFLRLRAVDTGFAEEEVLAVPLTLPGPQFEERGEMGRFLSAVEARLREIPGVASVGATNVAPLGGGGTVVNLSVEGRPSGPGETPFARWRSVTPGFFGAAGVSLLRGRLLDPTDYAPDAPAAIVVTQAFARRLFPGEDPVGRRVAMGVNGTNWRTVVGVVGDVRDTRLAEAPQPLFFLPEVGGWPWMTLLVRTSSDPAALAPAVRRAIWSLDPALAIPTVEPISAARREAVAGPRLNLLLMAAFAAVALLLAGLGVYGIMSHSVLQRTREIGIRIALGARPWRMLRMVLGRGVRLVAAGVALGAAAALVFARLLAALLFETPPSDPATLAGTAALLAAVGLASAWVPARRAARADPMEALRHE